MNKLCICALYHPLIHGSWIDDEAYSQYFYAREINIELFYNDEYLEILKFAKSIYNKFLSHLNTGHISNYDTHPIIQNYFRIKFKKKNYGLEIAKPITLQSGLTICIPKTFWLKIIQRKWKKHYKTLMMLKNPRRLLERQITGKW